VPVRSLDWGVWIPPISYLYLIAATPTSNREVGTSKSRQDLSATPVHLVLTRYFVGMFAVVLLQQRWPRRTILARLLGPAVLGFFSATNEREHIHGAVG
jgi:hypothetical protein